VPYEGRLCEKGSPERQSRLKYYRRTSPKHKGLPPNGQMHIRQMVEVTPRPTHKVASCRDLRELVNWGHGFRSKRYYRSLQVCSVSRMFPLRIFVSGDQSELSEERKSVIIAIGNVRQEPVAWETSGATSRTPQEWYEEEIRKCDIYIGVFGRQYSKPTCNEFLLASQIGLKRLVFLKFLEPAESRDNDLADFIVKEIKPRVRYENFSLKGDLQVRVERSLGELIVRIYHVPVKHRSGLAFLDQSTIEVIDLKRVAFSRELQLFFEDQFSHWATYNSLKKLVDRGLVQTNADWHHRWFYPNSFRWEEVREVARTKAELVNVYAKHDNSFRNSGILYDDYSEFLVEQALVANDFVIEARHTRQYRGKEALVRENQGAGRPPDLDLIVSLENRHHLGVQVKNRLDYPEAQSIRDFLGMCEQLQLRPLLVVRMAPENLLGQVTDSGGRAIVFKRWLLRPPFPRDTFREMLQLGIPAAVYTRVPDFLLARTRELAQWLSTNSRGRLHV